MHPRRPLRLRVEQLEPRLALASYHVSPSGNDFADGLTPQTAWKSLDRVTISGQFAPLYFGFKYQPGDKILFEGGKTFTGQPAFGPFNFAGAANNPVTIGSYGQGRATIASSSATGQPSVLTFYDVGGVTVQNLVVSGPGPTVGNYFHGINFVDRPDDLGTTTDRYRGITIDQVDAGNVSGSAVHFYSPRNTPSDPALLGYGDIKVTNSTLHGSRESGLQFSYRNVQGYYPFANVTVSQVRSFNNPGSDGMTNGNGFSIGGVDGGVVEYSIAHNNGAANKNGPFGGPTGFLVLDSNAVTLQYNEAFNTFVAWDDPNRIDGHGFDLDWGTQNSVLQYNYAHDNYGAGFAVIGTAPPGLNAQNSGNVVRFNVAENNGRRHSVGEISVFGQVTNLDIYNNTTYARDYGQNAVGNTAFRAFKSDGAVSYSNVRVTNNIFQTGFQVPVMLVDSGQNGAIPSFAGNVYWMETGRFQFFVNGTRYDRLTDFRNKTGQERLYSQSGFIDVGTQVDPGVTGAGTGGTFFAMTGFGGMTAYRLRPDSPIRGTGIDMTTLFGVNVGNGDFFGQPLAVDPLGRVRSNKTATPGADQFMSRFQPVVIADSVADFSGTQGAKGWFYGRSAAQVNNPFPAVVGFTHLPTFNAQANRWQQNAGAEPGLLLDSAGGHPGYVAPVNNQFAVRRWVSTYSGYVTLTGRVEHAVTNAGDGSNARLFLNGRPVHAEMTTPSYVTYKPQQFYTVTLWIQVGDTVDMAVDPRGNPAFDYTSFTLTVTTVPGTFSQIADSYRDFSAVQNSPDRSGLGSWMYGHYGTKYVPATFTTAGWSYNPQTTYWTNPSQPFAIHGSGEMHPGPNNFAARRWTSGTSGLVTLDLRARHNNESNPNGDGVVIRVYHNAAEVLLIDIKSLIQLNSTDPNKPDAVDIVARQFKLPLNVKPGHTVDIVLEMKGNANYDSTEVAASFTLRTGTDANYPNWGGGNGLASSTAGFSSTQGANGWTYGWSSAQVGVQNPAVVGFTPLAFFNPTTGRWQPSGGIASPFVGGTGGHPGYDAGFSGTWAVRRWTSTVAGNVTISGVAQLNTSGQGGGLAVRVFVDGTQRFSRTLSPTTKPTPFTYSVAATIGVGSIVDVAIDPLGDPLYDYADLTTVIRTA